MKREIATSIDRYLFDLNKYIPMHLCKSGFINWAGEPLNFNFILKMWKSRRKWNGGKFKF